MFSNSSQRKYWTFSNTEEITQYRENANSNYINSLASAEKSVKDCFLTAEEELMIVRYYENCLLDFLLHFKPRNEPLPKDVKGTAFHFYKRFFIVSSVMDYHPKEMVMTCIYLSCKICEYVVPIDVFVRSIGGNQKLVKNIILDQEMELIYRMGFKLNIFLPHRSIEGLMIDLRTRSNLQKPERLYDHINWFLASMWFTDICLIYSPALIALAAVMHAVSRCGENIDNFVIYTLLGYPPESIQNGIISTVRDIRSTVMRLKGPPPIEEITRLEKKLAVCRNPMNNPTSKMFNQRMMEYALESYGQ
uniref:Cyclin-like domain-containing protein n=1 Tax=Cuerna arida TaxID=1464854 RepID=A0A1B6GWR6_9HEMI